MANKKLKHVIEEVLDAKYMDNEDGGQFHSFSVNNNPDEENGIYVRLCSWDENGNHEEFNKFINRKVKITIETID